MGKYRIADLTLEIDVKGERLRRQAEPYRVEDDAPIDFTLDASEAIEADAPKIRKQAEMVERNDWEAIRMAQGGRDFDPNDIVTTLDELEYVATGAVFLARLLRFNGIGLHASAVVYEDAAYLFSAQSGTGKSTHTQLWRRAFGFDKTFILNDDKPSLRKIEGRWFAYGTPWSGKSDLNVPTRVPLQGIAFLERANENWIRRISPSEALYPFLNQTLRPFGKTDMNVALDRLSELLEDVPIFRLGCLPNVDAARTAYEAMKSERPRVF